jgi:hypothetical protein
MEDARRKDPVKAKNASRKERTKENIERKGYKLKIKDSSTIILTVDGKKESNTEIVTIPREHLLTA